MNEPSEKESAARALDPSLWLDRYGDYLYRYALSRLRDPEAAEETVQETFVSALRAREQYAGRGDERAWLLGILKRKIIDLVRRRVREQAAAGEDDDPAQVLFDQRGNWRADPRLAGTRPEASLERAEFWEAFWSCLGRLPQRQADAFTLRELEHLSSEEICNELEITASNLWVLLYRARLRLSECLKSLWREREGR